MHQRPIRVAVIGGGCAGVAAAFELSRPEHGGRYAVSVYQQGWRLGGKGASGRGVNDRIEEHGLHLWMGFYENAFRLLRECYRELGRDPRTERFADWSDVFEPDHYSGVVEWSSGGRWLPWTSFFPPEEGLPGDPYPAGPRWTVAHYLIRSLRLVRTLFEAVTLHERSSAAGAAPEGVDERPEDVTIEDVLARMARTLKLGELLTTTGLIEAIKLLELGLLPLLRGLPDNFVLAFHDAVAEATRRHLERLIHEDDELRRIWEIADLTMAVVRGSVQCGLLNDPRGFDAINDHDCREWLLRHGASPISVDSAFVRALYDLAFAFEGGDPSRPRIAAGQALRGALRAFFTYRGAFFWKMRTGMGDAVFAPFYQVLRRRGVRFEFFHRLTNVGLAPAHLVGHGHAPWVERLEFDVQARGADGGEYQPLIDVRGLPCWPAEPRWELLEQGARMRDEQWRFESHAERRRAGARTLTVGDDFDCVVLAVGLGAVPHVCREILDRDPRWREMVARVGTVATQAFQIWMSADMKELGWEDRQVNLSGFVEPFDTWADMRQLIADESWDHPPRSLAYFCSVLPDRPGALECGADYHAQRHDEVRANAVRFLDREVPKLWPRAARPGGGFRWDLLVDSDHGVGGNGRPDHANGSGAERFAAQFWTANVNPSDRYTLSLPGSQRHRISPLDRTYDNLTIAGDWTDCGFNEGCVEAAVMSGRLAAHAISSSPPLREIIGYDHP
jgi:uncharacterized protein with NAD-binding domain and iron-sulfur cluster